MNGLRNTEVGNNVRLNQRTQDQAQTSYYVLRGLHHVAHEPLWPVP